VTGFVTAVPLDSVQIHAHSGPDDRRRRQA
jgi:hypothetical protein